MYVGLLMLSNVAKIDFADFVDAMAGLVTAVFIVLTCNRVPEFFSGIFHKIEQTHSYLIR